MKLITNEVALGMGDQAFAGWGVDPSTGTVLLKMELDSRRIVVAMSPVEAQQIGCGAIYTFMSIAMAQQAQEARRVADLTASVNGKGHA